MRYFMVYPDYETGQRSGAGGFQIESIYEVIGDDEIDVSSEIDAGLHFFSEDELRTYLTKVFNDDQLVVSVE